MFEIISETPQATGYADAASATNKLETRRRLAHERYEIAHADVVQIEIRLGIDRRWEPTDPEYLEALKFMNDRKYHRALDKLHRLVVLRLFELHRMNLSGTGTYWKHKTYNKNCHTPGTSWRILAP